jgi:NAD(P)-dependent dehydrogenase (short-subunit alcohol dehydrogenase family)
VYRRSRPEADEAADAVRAVGRRALVLQADLADADACSRVVDDAVRDFGRLDVLVNMASRYEVKALDDLSIEDWDAQLAVDLRAVWLCAKAAIPHMRGLRGGRIINFADWVAASGRPRYRGYLPYYVAKAGVIALTQALALELASDRILVNAIAPGPIVPPEGTSAEEMAQVERATPLGRWGGEIEIAKIVLALVESDFVTGETIRVDGGRHLK